MSAGSAPTLLLLPPPPPLLMLMLPLLPLLPLLLLQNRRLGVELPGTMPSLTAAQARVASSRGRQAGSRS